MNFLKIDGSYGEGGGQILRSVISLSAITGKPIQIENIRKYRKNPGLKPQHLMGIKILSKICSAEVDGLYVGSTSVRFSPKKIEDLELNENIGTAGSIPLIFQILIPVISISKKSLKLSIRGGTDVPWSPTSNYTKYVLADAFERMGINFEMRIRKRGYYPKGGGIIDLEIQPSRELKSIMLTERTTKTVQLFSSYSKLSGEVVKDEIQKAENVFKKNGFAVDIEIKNEPALNAGFNMLAYSSDITSIIGVDGLMSQNSNLGTYIANKFIQNNLGVDYNLADMLVLPASLVGDTSVYHINEITKHLETNLYVVGKITECKYGIRKLDEGYEIRIKGTSNSAI